MDWLSVVNKINIMYLFLFDFYQQTRTLTLNLYLFYFHLMMRAAYTCTYLYEPSTMCNWTNKSIRAQTDVYKDVNKEPNAER